jgi:PPOX class probable F420-dependent enzyme
MDAEDARGFVRRHHRAILATFRSDGTAQLSPLLAGVDDEGRIEISSNAGKAKVRNLQRDPRASLLVMTERFFERRWIQIDGAAEVVPLPAAADALVAYEHRMAGERELPSDDELRRRHAESNAVLVRIAIERVGPKGAALDPS